MRLIGIRDQMARRQINSVAPDSAQQVGSDVYELRRLYIALNWPSDQIDAGREDDTSDTNMS